MAGQIAVAGVALLKEFISAGFSYLACREHERTEREKIAAQLEAYITAINSNYSMYSKILDANQANAMRVYDMAENLLKNSSVYTNPILLQGILTFVQNTHSENRAKMIALTNAVASTKLPRIG